MTPAQRCAAARIALTKCSLASILEPPGGCMECAYFYC
jgi:hypothetical protein